MEAPRSANPRAKHRAPKRIDRSLPPPAKGRKTMLRGGSTQRWLNLAPAAHGACCHRTHLQKRSADLATARQRPENDAAGGEHSTVPNSSSSCAPRALSPASPAKAIG